MKSLADALKEKRSERGYTQTDVANLIGVSLRMIMYYEGYRWPPHEILLKLNTLFQYDFSRHIYERRYTSKNDRAAKRGHVNNAG